MNESRPIQSRSPKHRVRRASNAVVGIVVASWCALPAAAEPGDRAARLDSPAGGWTLAVAPDGSFERLDMTFAGRRVNVPWRPQGDPARGPAWAGVELTRVPGDDLRYAGRSGDAEYALAYRDAAGRLTIEASIRNHGAVPLVAQPSVRLSLGMNHEMKEPRTYFQTFFPSLLRCERTHFWGYFQTPNGQVLAVGSPDAVASWALGYLRNGHRIATSHLDLLHGPPLPPRHPQGLGALPPGAAQAWHIVLQPVAALDEVPAMVATLCGAPAVALDRTSAAPGETVELTVYYGGSEALAVTIVDEDGQASPLPAPRQGASALHYAFPAPTAAGQYTIEASAGGKRTEAVLCVRKPWGWYLEQARAEALRMQQKPMMHREGWLGFFSGYWAERYAPDPARLAETEEKFQAFFAAMVDPATGHFYRTKHTWPDRPQNSAWMLGLLTLRAAVTGDVEHLERAADWADDFIARFQKPDGAFTHGKNSYGALTLGTKFLHDLVRLEQEHDAAAGNRRFAAALARHVAAVDRAVANLETAKDRGHTEGEPTYEDNQAGSAWSLLALHALTTDDPALRAHRLATSLEVRGRHECLTQALIPDGRMRGGTLRWWEAQYDVLTSPSMMNSPHGWTMRSQFGAIYLYLLTGEERFLNLACNVMGACVQAIDHETGRLRWAFVPDPFVEARQFVPDPEKPGQGRHVPAVVGEQWLPMISDWWRVPEGKVAGMRDQGWSCDNDVHEHFRWLAEQFVPNAFVLERADGTLRAWNCRAERDGETIAIVPAEPVVSRVHLNLRRGRRVTVRFAKEAFDGPVEPGMRWIGPGGPFIGSNRPPATDEPPASRASDAGDVRAADIVVAPDGDDANPGTEARPLRTLPGAIAAVRMRKRAEGLPAGGLVVQFRGGKYLWTGTSGAYATLTAADSGEPGKPIVYASRPGERARFIGGRELDASWFRPVTEADAVWNRLDEAARGRVVRCDLAGHGIGYYGELNGNTWSRRGTFKPWLHGGGRRLPLARWPDGEHDYEFGAEKTSATKKRNEFEYEGDRPARWLDAPDGWIFGNLGKGYIHSHERITAIDPGKRRITLAEEPENHQQDLWRWAALNLVEEITQPGEWYVDRRDGTLYVWPPQGGDAGELFFTTHGRDGSRFIAADNVSHVTFAGLTMEVSMRTGISGTGCGDLRLDGCTVRCMDNALVMTGTNIVVTDSEFCHLDGIGVRLKGGDEQQLVGSGNRIENNLFHHVGMWSRASSVAVTVLGCGTEVAHNEIHDCPALAALLVGPRHLFRCNDVARCLLEGEEQGVVQTGGWTYGMRIEHNVLRELDSSYGPPFKHGCGAIVFERTSGFTLEGNIISIDDERVTTGDRGFSGVINGGGRDYRLLNNVITGATTAIAGSYSAATGDKARAAVENTRAALDGLGAFTPGSAWYEAFPQIHETDFSAPERVLRPTSCVARGNVGSHNVQFFGDYAPQAAPDTITFFAQVRDNLDLDQKQDLGRAEREIGFYDRAAGCLALRDDSPAFDVPGFQRIPWELAGRLHATHVARPVPPVGCAAVPAAPSGLFWAPARQAAAYAVYIGTDREAVERRDASVLRGRPRESRFVPGTLASGTRYHWAVDAEARGGGLLGRGATWSFTTAGQANARGPNP